MSPNLMGAERIGLQGNNKKKKNHSTPSFRNLMVRPLDSYAVHVVCESSRDLSCQKLALCERDPGSRYWGHLLYCIVIKPLTGTDCTRGFGQRFPKCVACKSLERVCGAVPRSLLWNKRQKSSLICVQLLSTKPTATRVMSV